MSTDQTNHKPIRHNAKQASKVIHELWQPRIDVDHRKADTRFRIAAISGVIVFILGLIIGDQANRPEVIGIGVVLGLMVFVIALAKAAGHYKRGYRKFVTDHMANDGTFLLCPQCRAALGDLEDPQIKSDPPTQCLKCGTTPWRFEDPIENPKRG